MCPLVLLWPVEEIELLSELFQQKQRELLLAVSRVEELSDQLEALRRNRLEVPPPLYYHHSTSIAELKRLYKELQVRIPTWQLWKPC